VAADLSPLWVSLRTASVATVLTVVLGTALAWMRTRLRRVPAHFLDGLLLLPLVLPPTAVGLLLLLPLGARGWIGQALGSVHVSLVFTWTATVIAATVMALPLMYLSARSGFQQIEPDYAEAARTQGASGWAVLRHIVLPLAAPSLVTGALLSLARTLGEFGATLMLAGNIPGKTQTIPLAIYFALEGGDDRTALLWALVSTVIALAALAAANLWPGLASGTSVAERPLR
jgi:molybdate transport system permease protein